MDPLLSTLATNRGNKLAIGARTARLGKLARSSVSMPSAEELTRLRKRRRLDITPHVAYVPSAVASRKTQNDGPEEAFLPPPPRNALDIVTSPSILRCFASKESNLVGLALSAIGLIEADSQCVRTLTRICSVLRSDELSWVKPVEDAKLKRSVTDREPKLHQSQSRNTINQPDSSEYHDIPMEDASTELESTNIIDKLSEYGGSTEENKLDTVSSPGKKTLDEVATAEEARVEAAFIKADEEADPQQAPPDVTRNALVSKGIVAPSDNALTFPLNIADNPYIKQILSPSNYIDKLFVSPTSIIMPTPHYLQQQPIMIGPNTLTPAEQTALLQASINELQRFLADTLEYQARLREITDGVLSVERRRKGTWSIIQSLVSSPSERK